MNRYILGAAVAALAAAVPAAAPAQQLPPAVVAVVDTDRIFQTCTVCAAAQQQLQAQLTQLQQRAQALGQPLQTEEQALTTLVGGLSAGQQPDAALQQRIQAFQTQSQNAQRELATRQEQIQRNAAFVRQQIGQRIQPAIVQVMQQRGANLALDRNSGTLAINPALEVTDAVLALVNQNTTPLNVNAPPPQQQQPAAQPQQPQQQRPRPPGR